MSLPRDLRRALRRGSDGWLFVLDDLRSRPRAFNQALIRSLCANAYVGEGTVLCRVLGRYKMFVDAADLGLSSHLMLDGYWEMWLTEAIAAAVRPGMVVADIGANLGYFSLLMADLVGEEGRVHAFEPNPPIADRLAKSVTLNGFDDRARVHQVALGAEEGQPLVLYVPAGEPKNAHITAVPEGPGRIALHSRRLDGFAELAEVAVIKIDAEAAERDIWRGMAAILAARRPLTIFMEFASARYADPGEFLDEIVAEGFSLAVLTFKEGVAERTKQQILDAPANIDQMLVLRR